MCMHDAAAWIESARGVRSGSGAGSSCSGRRQRSRRSAVRGAGARQRCRPLACEKLWPLGAPLRPPVRMCVCVRYKRCSGWRCWGQAWALTRNTTTPTKKNTQNIKLKLTKACPSFFFFFFVYKCVCVCVSVLFFHWGPFLCVCKL